MLSFLHQRLTKIPCIAKNLKSCLDTQLAFSTKQLIIQMENLIMSFKTTAFCTYFEDQNEWSMYHSGPGRKRWLAQTR